MLFMLCPSYLGNKHCHHISFHDSSPHHKQELTPALQHLVEQGHSGGHVGHPVQAGERGDQGERGGVGGDEGGALRGVQLLECHVGGLGLLMLLAVGYHVIRNIHSDNLRIDIVMMYPLLLTSAHLVRSAELPQLALGDGQGGLPGPAAKVQDPVLVPEPRVDTGEVIGGLGVDDEVRQVGLGVLRRRDKLHRGGGQQAQAQSHGDAESLYISCWNKCLASFDP